MGAGTSGDALFPAGVEHGGVFPLKGGHGLDNGFNALEIALVHRQVQLFSTHAGEHPHDILHGTHTLELNQLVVKVGQGELVFPQPLHLFGGFFGVQILLRFLNKGEHVAHTQDAAGHTVGVEYLHRVQLFAGAGEFDGLAGDGPDGESRAAPGVAVQLGEHDAVDVQRVVKGFGGGDRVLADHGVHHQQNLGGGYGFFDPAQLVHQRFIHVEPPGSVQKHHIIAVLFGVFHRSLGNVHRVDLPHLEHRDVQLLAHYLQLLDGGGTVHIAGGQEGPLALLFHQARQLGAVGGLAGALKAHQHDNGGGGGGDGQFAAAAHEGGQFLIDDLYNHLGGGEGFHHVLAHGPLGDRGHKAFNHLEIDVRLQKGHFDLLHGLLHIGLGQTALAPQALEHGGQLIGETFKCHNSYSCSSLATFSLIVRASSSSMASL